VTGTLRALWWVAKVPGEDGAITFPGAPGTLNDTLVALQKDGFVDSVDIWHRGQKAWRWALTAAGSRRLGFCDRCGGCGRERIAGRGFVCAGCRGTGRLAEEARS
jgi:hypothetical protein